MEFVHLAGAETVIEAGENPDPPTVTLVLIGKDNRATEIKLEGDAIYQVAAIFLDLQDRLPPRKAAH
jgi:hypothetical protein